MNFGFDNDHERPLSLDGIRDAGKMGRYLTVKNEVPEYIISSTALRAKSTIEIAMGLGEWGCPIALDFGIYGGDAQFLLNLIKKQNNIYNIICLVGHEPNFSNFISLSSNSDFQHFPTASMAKINFNVEKWFQIELGFGDLDWLIQPEDIDSE